MAHRSTPDMDQLFAGFMDSYGVYILPKDSDAKEGEKQKGRAATKKGKVTWSLWDHHLNGHQGLGIIPINGDNKCKFGAIDIDEYPLNLLTLSKCIRDHELPLILCRTKSGGAHLYVFLREYHSAKAVQKKLREFAAFLGYGDSEIYPKQTQILAERGDQGQWINMPYFDEQRTNRYALGKHHEQLNLEDFIKYAQELSIQPTDFDNFQIKSRESLPGGPPCLQFLCSRGFPAGTRNNGLFNLGVYARKVCPDTWREQLEKYNTQFMDPPLTSEEVQGVTKSLDKKEYVYTCKAAPIISYCNAEECRGCKHGIGGQIIGMPKFGSLSKLNTEPPIWFLDIEGGGRMELTTEAIQSPILFQKACMEHLNIMPGIPKREIWQGIVQRLMQELEVIEVPKDATPRGQLIQLLEDFCTSRAQARQMDEILLGKPWTDNGRHYFRLKDFISYLDRQRYKVVTLNFIASYLRDNGAQKEFKNIKGRGTNLYSVPEFKGQLEGFTPPVQENKPQF